MTSYLACDSIVNLQLQVSNMVQTGLTDTVCLGTAYMFNGQTLFYSGLYFDTLQATGGCDSVVVLGLVVDSSLNPIITAENDTLLTGNFNSYQWLLNDTPLVDQTQQNLVVLQNGSYRVAVTTPAGCSDTSSAWNVLGMGLGDLAMDGAVLFPNPNNGIFTLAFNDSVTKEIEIADAVGKVILSTKAGSQQRFQLENLAQGIYFIRLKQNGSKSLRFSVMR